MPQVVMIDRRLGLDLSYFNLISLGGIESVPRINEVQKLYLNSNPLITLPNSIGNLVQLWWISLTGCTSLTVLPDSIGQLTHLQNLYLSHCTSLTVLPDSIGQLTQLAALQLIGCTALKALPDSIGQSEQLRLIYINDCVSLTVLPDLLLQKIRTGNIFVVGTTWKHYMPAILRGVNTVMGLLQFFSHNR
jgi:hypothetical protein